MTEDSYNPPSIPESPRSLRITSLDILQGEDGHKIYELNISCFSLFTLRTEFEVHVAHP